MPNLFARAASFEAPGLVCFGAEIDPAMADPLHTGDPAVSVSGVGPSPQEAFQRCIWRRRRISVPHFGIPAARVIAPGLQPEPSEIVMPRLADMMARTGGGAIYTGGVALI
jgi:hypothetical protein